MYKLLIIDDEPAILAGMQKILDWNAYGFGEVAVAGSYQEALERAIILQPDLCLCDVCLKEHRIYELIDRLEALGHPSHYIIMSGYSDFAYVQSALRRRAVDYLLKPVDTESLREAVEKVIVEKLGGRAEDFQEEAGLDPVLKRPTSELSSLVGKIVAFVASGYQGEMTLKLLGEKFYMSAPYLGQLFLQETGMKFTDYVTQFRMNRAYWQIRNTNDKISVIAASVGYDNMGYFYTQFKAAFGVSPTEVRKNQQ